ncbi:MAG: tetratricopeptide repeat protein, partial [Acidobacteria bacterium]|nr:tetratricopeptide repeat protein [Acidobacteriota bacterium]
LDNLASGARVHLFRGSQAMRAGNLEVALAEFRAAVAAAPENPSARLNLGAALAQSGQLEPAIKELERALDLGLSGVNLSKTHFNLGALEAMTGRPEPAAEHLRQALRWNPQNQAARSLLERIESRSGSSR